MKSQFEQNTLGYYNEAIEKRIDICEEMQSKDKLSIKTDCNEFVNTIDGVNVIAYYLILRALDDWLFTKNQVSNI